MEYQQYMCEERFCQICGTRLEPDEIEICDSCKAAMVESEDMEPFL